MGRTGTVPGQQSLFTHRGSPYTPERQIRELRVDVIRHLVDLYRPALGEPPDLPQPCPECGGTLRAFLHPDAPVAWCECGFVLSLREGARKP